MRRLGLRKQMKQEELARLRASERTMILVRWFASIFALIQVLTYYRPYPKGLLAGALATVAVLALGNAVVWFCTRRLPTSATRPLAVAASIFDFAVVLAFVWLYSFDSDTAIWALIYILPLQGAIRFQRLGAIVTMFAASVAYTAREVYGSAVYGYDFLPTSVTFRMGIGFIIAAVAGAMSSRLLRERDRVALLHETSRSLASSLDETQVLNALARSACDAVNGRFAIVFEGDETGLRSIASYGAPHGYGRHLVRGFVTPSLQRTPAVRAAREGKVVWVEDVASEFEGNDELGHLAKTADDVGFASLVAVPVPTQEREHPHVLAIYFTAARQAAREEENFLQGLADAAATALTHASDYGRQQKATEELRRLQEERSQLFAMIAHDLRMPLTVIRGIASALRKLSASPEKQEELLEIIDEQVVRVNRLVTDILDLARLEAGRLEIVPERVNLREVVQAALRALPDTTHVGTDIPDALEVLADPKRLSDVVVNLVSNALQHGSPPVTVTGGRRDQEVLLEVADCGEGLPASRASAPFEAFVPGKTEGSIGLGLAIVRGLIEAHGGRVFYQENQPSGARFVCTLPAPPWPASDEEPSGITPATR